MSTSSLLSETRLKHEIISFARSFVKAEDFDDHPPIYVQIIKDSNSQLIARDSEFEFELLLSDDADGSQEQDKQQLEVGQLLLLKKWQFHITFDPNEIEDDVIISISTEEWDLIYSSEVEQLSQCKLLTDDYQIVKALKVIARASKVEDYGRINPPDLSLRQIADVLNGETSNVAEMPNMAETSAPVETSKPIKSSGLEVDRAQNESDRMNEEKESPVTTQNVTASIAIEDSQDQDEEEKIAESQHATHMQQEAQPLESSWPESLRSGFHSVSSSLFREIIAESQGRQPMVIDSTQGSQVWQSSQDKHFLQPQVKETQPVTSKADAKASTGRILIGLGSESPQSEDLQDSQEQGSKGNKQLQDEQKIPDLTEKQSQSTSKSLPSMNLSSAAVDEDATQGKQVHQQQQQVFLNRPRADASCRA